MSDTRTEGQEEEIVVAVPQPSVGERLRAAREAKGMSSADVAASLKLSPRQIDALEAGDWSSLPGNAFIRGFVRNYARAVQIDANALLGDLDVPTPQPPRLDPPQNVTAVMPSAGDAKRRDYAAVLAGLVLVAIAVVAYFVVPPDLWESKPEEKVVEQQPAASPVEPAKEAAVAAPGSEGRDSAPAAIAQGAIDQTKAVAADAAASPAPAGNVPAVAPATPAATPVVSAAVGKESAPAALKFKFAQPSWVEVRDRSGQIVFSQLNAAGSEHALDGQPPFSLVVGNAAHVTVTYKGRTVELQPRSKDDVARVTVE